MMKIAHITSVHPRYDSRIFIKECITLSSADYDITLIVADGKGDEVKEGVVIHDVGNPRKNNRFLRMTYTVYKIFKAVRLLSPQVIHFHDPELLMMALCFKRYGAKVIYDIHEDVPRQLLTKCWIPKLIRPFVGLIFKMLENYIAYRFDALVVTTADIAKRFVNSIKPIVVLFNYPLLSEMTHQISWSLRKNEVCYLGSISRIRGILVLIEALSEAQVPLQLAGSWSESDLRDQLIGRSGWHFVNELGVLDRKEVVRLLGTVKVGLVTLLSTPSHQWALPIKLFEYMAAGLPVIASNFPLWRTIIEEEKCGVIVDPADAHAIATAIHKLLKNESLSKKMGEAGRAAVLKKYNWENESNKLLLLYQTLTQSL